jgi:hypothetical protein
MKTNLLSTTALILSLGLLSPLIGARVSIAYQSLDGTEQSAPFVLAQKLDQIIRDRVQRDAQQRQQQNTFEPERPRPQNQRQQSIFAPERLRQQQDAQQHQPQRNVILERLRPQNQRQQSIFAPERLRQQRDAQQLQQQHLQAERERQIENRREREDRFNRRFAQQRDEWQRQRDRNLRNWQRQQRAIERERRLDRMNARYRNLYRNYVTYYNRDYWEDSTWRNRNYWDNRSFWGGPGYWYERDYWSQNGYIWDDLLSGILPLLISGLVQGATDSSYRITPANTLYVRGSEILSYNGLTQAACEPGNVIILLPNQRVMCATPTESFAPGTYKVVSPGLRLIPVDIQY